MKTRSTAVRVMLLLAAAGLLSATGCDDSDRIFGWDAPDLVHGNGIVVEEPRAISDFTRVNLQGVGILYLQEGARPELRIRAEENLLQYLGTSVQAGELLIWKDSVTLMHTRPMEYHLTVVGLDRLAVTGAGNIEGSNLDTGPLALLLTGAGNIELIDLNAPSVDVVVSGVGKVVLSGSVQQQSIDLRGMGGYDARDLNSAEADVRIASMGSATVRVSHRLDATIHGSGSVFYIGDPIVRRSGAGSGGVVQVAE
jgi:hypothetical protein